MARKFLLMFVVCLVTASTSLMALGLGEIKLKSGLNQPLEAEILLLSVRGESNEQLNGSLGSSTDFDRSGIERVYFLSKIRFETITKANGQKVLQLSTEDAVKEPFLNFLVNLEWPNGRLLREYTLLLDPPIFDEAPKATVAPAVSQSRPQSKPVKVKPRYVAPKPQWEGDIYGPTTSSDTLWGIASKVRPDRSVTMQQAMVTIFEANPDAFMRGNINNLKRGAEIRVPDSDTFSQISQREALRMIAVHNENWKSSKRTPPVVVMDTSSEDSYASSSEPEKSETGRLSLSADDSDTGTGGSSASAVLNEEENEVLKQQNEVLQQQSQTDAEKIQQLERLIELKNEQLAMMQNSDASDQQVETAEVEAATESTISEVGTTTEAAKPESDPEPELADVTPAVTQQPVTVTSSIVDDLMAGTYNLYLAIAGGIVLLLLISSVLRRRNEDIDYNEAVADATAETDTEVTGSSDKLPEIADDVLAGTESLDFDDTEAESTDTSDPLGEADIYIAYGKFEQAESLLLSALEDNPERMELNSKLLECYAEMDNKDKFEGQVDVISTAIESDSELGKYVEELYQTAWPEGELFASDINDDTDEEIDDEFELTTEDDTLEDDTLEDDTLEDEYPEGEYPEGDEESINVDLDDDLEELPSTEDVFGDDSTDELEDEAEFNIEEAGDDSDEDDEDEDNDVDTQLDLARAYVEMGDIEGTREIIEEIMTSGTEQQCEEAQKILDSLEDK